MNQENLVEKLSLQVESFQEGFELLSKSHSLSEMADVFSRLVRGNFLITDVCIFHKKDSQSWQPLQSNINSFDKYLSGDEEVFQLISLEKDVKYSFAVKYPLIDGSFFGILIGKKLSNQQFEEVDKITLQIFLQLLGSAYQTYLNIRKEKELVFDLNEKILQLNNLIDTGIELSKIQSADNLLKQALTRIVSASNASAGLIEVADENKILSSHSFPDGTENKIIKNSDKSIESSFEFMNLQYRFIICDKESREGYISFNEIDKSLLDAVTRQVNASIENDYLIKQNIEKEKIEQEIEVAASIQKRIIPIELPKIPGYDVAGINIPSKQVGGDYYDCIDLGDGKFALIIADVAGKGISAALLVSTLNAALYSYLNFDISLADMSDKLNKLIYNSSPSDKFITFFIAVLNSKTGELDIVNAGHNPILVLKDDKSIYKIDAGGVGLGMFDFGIPYEGTKLTLQKGERLFLYTDGIPEAMNDSEEEYSDERMEKFFQNNITASSQEFVDELVKDVKSFSGNAEQSDDITILYLINK